jgi:hypothetical protein
MPVFANPSRHSQQSRHQDSWTAAVSAAVHGVQRPQKTVPDPGIDEAVARCAELPRQLPILVTTVDIGEDQSDQIELYEGDSPEVHIVGLKWLAPRSHFT